MDIKIRKKDLLMASIAGELAAWLSFPILKNLKIFDILAYMGIGAASFSIFWVLFVPAGAVLSLNFFYFLAKLKNKIGFFELGKYGIIGVLNTFLNAGVYNLLIFITNIASGFIIDTFFIAAFTITVVNSFLWNKFWTFSEKGVENIKTEAIQFFSISAIVAIVNGVILHVIINVIGAPIAVDPKIWANVALGFTIITAFFGNFFSYKYIVFSKRSP